jgi:hypothetical protein
MNHLSKFTTLAIAALLAGSQPVLAQPLKQSAKKNSVIQIPATVISIQGSVKRMISYRDQNHSWQSSDSAIHLVVNLGSTPAGKGLALYSSFDNGVTWTQMFTLASTDGASTDDGVLTNTPTGATLQLVYSTSPNIGTIMYATAIYDSSSQSWTLASTQTAFSSPGIVASNPAFAADTAGNLWCGFTEEVSATLEYQEELIYQAAGTQQWVDTGLILGQVDNTTQHSARPVPYVGGVGVIYEDENTLYWAYRLNGSAYNAPWVTSTLYVGLPPESSDPYDTHYSVVADSSNNLYLAFVSAPADLTFAIFSSDANAWTYLQTLETSASSAAYPEISIAGGNLMLMANYETSVKVMQATSYGPAGANFTTTQILTHAPAVSGSGISYGRPRVEAPRNSTSPVPVWQQFVDGVTEELMFFQVPVIN